MKAENLRNALNAHGWVGLCISVPLFVVFWAGAITLFHHEIQHWAMMPQKPLSANHSEININRIIEQNIKDFNIATSERIFFYLPDEHSHYAKMRFTAIERQPNSEGDIQTDATDVNETRQFKTLHMEPGSGKIMTIDNPFSLSDFLYQLHYNFKLPQGKYIVGFVTLFFLVLLITGLIIQLKNLIKHFFLYRQDKSTRYQMQDIHTIIGVITLPFGLVYALTGLMFNLNLLMQIPTVVVLYKGDFPQVVEDAGFGNVTAQEPVGIMAMPDLNQLVNDLEEEYKARITMLDIYNYGHENAVIRFRGEKLNSFALRFEKNYKVSSGEMPTEMNPPPNNVFADGTRIMYNLHFGNFAGVDLRVLYFLLALGVCGMIVAGNILWLTKRLKQDKHPKIKAVMQSLTIGGCMGVLPATSVAFLLERVLSADLANRGAFVEVGFGLVLFSALLLAAIYKNYLSYCYYALMMTALGLVVTLTYESFVYGSVILQLHQQGFGDVAGFSIGLTICSVLCVWVAMNLKKRITQQGLGNKEQLLQGPLM